MHPRIHPQPDRFVQLWTVVTARVRYPDSSKQCGAHLRTPQQVMEMGRSLPPLLFAIVFLSLGIEQGIAYQPPADSPPPVVLPLGSKVEMALTRPVWAAKAKAGDPLYLQTIFPVTVGNSIAIPAGTYVAGTIDSIRSEEHTSELQSLRHLVCRLLL